MHRPPTRPVLRYHGGKFGNKGSFADWIIGHFPAHRVYVEPYGGAGSVLLRKPRAPYAEVYNDIWDDVVTVFRVLRDPVLAARLEELVRLTPYARAEYEHITRAPRPDDPVELARRVIFRSFAGFGSAAANLDHDTGFRGTSKRSGTSPAGDWRNWADQVRLFTARLAGVTIEHLPALEVMRRHDGPDTLHYVDPPYLHSTCNVRERSPGYVHEMDEGEHRALASALCGLSGMVVLSGYPSELYDDLFAGWARIERPTFADGARPRTEVLWLSPACVAALRAAGGAVQESLLLSGAVPPLPQPSQGQHGR